MHANCKALQCCMESLLGGVAPCVANDQDVVAEEIHSMADKHDVLIPVHELHSRHACLEHISCPGHQGASSPFWHKVPDQCNQAWTSARAETVGRAVHLALSCCAAYNDALNAALYLPLYQPVILSQVDLPVLKVGRLCSSNSHSRLQLV